MSIRLPLQTVMNRDIAGDLGAGSILGGVPLEFTIPQDTDNVVVKFTASTVGGAVSAVLQTTDDSGNTWWDIARTSVITNANDTVTAEWITATTTPPSAAFGRAAASTLAGGAESGMPLLSQRGRVFVIMTGNLTANTLCNVEVMVNSQSATA